MKKALASLCLLACLPAAAAFAQRSPAYGTTVTSYLSLGAGAFQAEDSAQTYARTTLLTTSGVFWAYPQLPSGASIVSIALDFCDDSGGLAPGLGVYLLDRFGNATAGGSVDNQPDVVGCQTETLTSFDPMMIMNGENRMVVRVAPIGTVGIAGLVIGYKLQVSPAPAVATFNDVPTSDFGFQYVEALAASGITGGCGGGNYCPDSPVTRRQMAIFISKALGLQWP